MGVVRWCCRASRTIKVFLVGGNASPTCCVALLWAILLPSPEFRPHPQQPTPPPHNPFLLPSVVIAFRFPSVVSTFLTPLDPRTD